MVRYWGENKQRVYNKQSLFPLEAWRVTQEPGASLFLCCNYLLQALLNSEQRAVQHILEKIHTC